jgi:hypothetical protein
MQPSAYPVQVTGTLTEPLSRWLWLVKIILFIPHVVVLAVLGFVSMLFVVLTFLAVLFTGRYPRLLFDFNVGFLRWGWRVSFYTASAFATDAYPPFTMREGGYPADITVEYPERMHRGLVLIKWLLAIPQFWIAGIFSELIQLLAVIAAVVVLFTGRYPAELFEFIMGLNRWSWRVSAYAFLLTDKYPPFSLK